MDDKDWEQGDHFARHEALVTYHDALVKIRDRDWVENVLDPQWAPRVAREALAAKPQPDKHVCPSCKGRGNIARWAGDITCPACGGEGDRNA